MLYSEKWTVVPSSSLIMFDMACNCLYQAGWELWDPISATDKIYRSRGESGKFPWFYLRVTAADPYNIGGQLFIYGYFYWNKTAHTGILMAAGNKLGHTRHNSYFPLYIAVNKNGVALIQNNGGDPAWWACCWSFTGIVTKLFSEKDCILKITSPLTAGTNVAASVESLDENQIRVGLNYQLSGGMGEGRWITTISAYSQNQIIISEVPQSLGIDEANDLYPMIGDFPWRGMNFGETGYPGHGYPICNYGYSGLTQSAGLWHFQDEWDTQYADPMPNQRYIPSPIRIRSGNNVDPATQDKYVGWLDTNLWVKCLAGAADDLFVRRNNFNEAGAVTSSTGSSITDTSKSWQPNVFANAQLICMDGANAGKTRKIASNTQNTISVYKNFDNIPGTSDLYRIVDFVYRKTQYQNILLGESIF